MAWRRPSRRAVGKAMVGTGILGLVLSLVGTVVGYRLVDQVHESVDDSLVVTDEAITSVRNSIIATRSLVETTRVGLGSVSTTIGSIRESLGAANRAVAGSEDFLSGSLPDSIAAINAVMPTIVDVSSTIDDTLRALSAVPFGPDYRPAVPFDVAIGQLAKALQPLPDDLREVTTSFGDLQTSTANVDTNLGTLRTSIDSLIAQADSIDTLLDQYETTAADAQRLATGSRSDLTGNSRLARVMIVVLGITFALSQIVPIWLGRALMGDGSHVEAIITREHHEPQRE